MATSGIEAPGSADNVAPRGGGLDGVPAGSDKRRSISFWLRWLVIVCIVPAWAAATFFIVDSYQRGRQSTQADMVATARALVQTVDGELSHLTSALLVLATSRSLAAGDLADFHVQAQEALRAVAAYNIILTDRGGQQVVNTLRPFGTVLPSGPTPHSLRNVFALGTPAISDLLPGPVTGQPIIGVAVPVSREGQTIYRLTAGLLPEHFSAVLAQQAPPSDWIISIFDSTGTIVARNRNAAKFVGSKGTPALVSRMGEVREDVLEAPTLEGIPVLIAFRRSPLTGWSVAIGVPSATLVADLRRSLWLNLVTGGIFLIAGVVLAGTIKNRLARSIRTLGEPAAASATGGARASPASDIDEVAEVREALARAAQLLVEREAAERQAAVAERVAARFGALLEAAPEAMILVRPGGTISFANGHAETIFGYPKAALLGQSVESLIPREVGAAHRSHVAGFLVTPQLRAMGAGLPLFGRRRDDTAFPVEVSLSPIEIDGEHCVVAAIRDVTERKRLEAKVEAGRLQLVDSARLSALGEMAGGIAHEINNPLAVIDALNQNLAETAAQRETTPEAVMQATGKIALYVDRIGKIVRSMQHIVRDGARDPLDDVAVVTIVEQVLSICSQRFRGHSVALLTAPIDPALRIACREVQIAQVLLNLLQNAFDAVQELRGDKWVRVDVEATDDTVVLSVIDSGHGLPPELKARVMEPFFTTKPVGKGTGLGLSLSKQIAEDHGGTLSVDEDRGHTRFSLALARFRQRAIPCS